MIILYAYLTYKGGLVIPHKVVEKWPNEYSFGFQINNPDNWRNFLEKKRFQGKRLPRKDNNGNPIVYRVATWGGLKGMGQGQILSLFPGKLPDGKTRLVDRGRLRG